MPFSFCCSFTFLYLCDPKFYGETNLNFKMINMEKVFEKFILPIESIAHAGCGFFVDNLFVTAGHVAVNNELPLTIYFNGKTVKLDKSNLLFARYVDNEPNPEDNIDVALFKVEGVNSPLKLADYRPKAGEQYVCYSFNDEVFHLNQQGVPAIFSSYDQIVPVSTPVKVLDKTDGKFFGCESEKVLQRGNSGSPLIDAEGNVVGILHGGVPDTNQCVFQYADMVRKFC